MLRRDDGRIGFAELVCDPVLVFAVTEVSDSLLAQDDPKGAHQAGFLLLAVWWARIASTWVLNRPMTGGRFLALVQAFGGRGLVFALACLGMQVGRTVFVLASGEGSAMLRRTKLHIPMAMVASEPAIAHPADPGVLALFLAGNGLFKRVSANSFPVSHWVGKALDRKSVV